MSKIKYLVLKNTPFGDKIKKIIKDNQLSNDNNPFGKGMYHAFMIVLEMRIRKK